MNFFILLILIFKVKNLELKNLNPDLDIANNLEIKLNPFSVELEDFDKEKNISIKITCPENNKNYQFTSDNVKNICDGTEKNINSLKFKNFIENLKIKQIKKEDKLELILQYEISYYNQIKNIFEFKFEQKIHQIKKIEVNKLESIYNTDEKDNKNDLIFIIDKKYYNLSPSKNLNINFLKNKPEFLIYKFEKNNLIFKIDKENDIIDQKEIFFEIEDKETNLKSEEIKLFFFGSLVTSKLNYKSIFYFCLIISIILILLIIILGFKKKSKQKNNKNKSSINMMTTRNSNEELPESIVEYNKRLAEKYKQKSLKKKDESFMFLTEEDRMNLEKTQNISMSFISMKDKEINFNNNDISVINKSPNASPNQKNRSFLNSFFDGIKL